MTGTKPVLDSPRRMTAAARKRRRASAVRKFFFGVFAVIIIAIAGLCGYLRTSPLGLMRLFGQGAQLLHASVRHTPPFHGKTHVNILILGTDVNFVDKGIPRSDTIKLASVDMTKPSISILSIPRDTWVEIPGYGHGKINSAYQRGGDVEIDRVRSAQSVVSSLLSSVSGQEIPIDYYVRIQTGGFKKIVDALGGVEIDVEKQMDYDDNYQNLYIHLKPGRQLLDGKQAMGYVRFRHDAEGDYGRMRRQDQFIRALAAQLEKPETKSRLPQVLGAVDSMLKTDLTLNDIRAIKRVASTLGMEGIHTVQLPTQSGWKGRAAVEEVTDYAAAQQAISDLLNGPRPTVVVVNGSGKRNLARAVSEKIDSTRYNVVGVGTLPKPVETTEVLAVKRCKNEALGLASLIGVTGVDTETPAPQAEFGKRVPAPPPCEITLVIGKNYPALEQARGLE
ncbi:MAG: LCP family protein [Armatimonadota bacterium]